MKIAMIGQKSMVVEGRAGGIEKHVAKISTRLVEAGHEVTVYSRTRYAPERPTQIDGVKVKYIPTIYTKNLEAIIHTFLSTLHAVTGQYDIIHYHGVGPSTLAWIPRLLAWRTSVVTTFHAQDKYHTKWGVFARAYLNFGEWAAVHFAHYCITVSHVLQVYCRRKFKREVVYIPNGAELKEVSSFDELAQFDLEPQKYILNVGRLVPQKGLQFLIKAFREMETEMKLVFVGRPSFSDQYYKKLRRLAAGDARIKFLGFQSGDTLDQLYAGAYIFCSPSESEGLPLVVLEAMSFGVAAFVSDIPENLEAIHHTGFTFHSGDVIDLREQLTRLIHHPEQVRERAEESRAVIEVHFNWDMIASHIESVYITSRH